MEKHTPGPWHVRPNLGPNVVSEHGDDPATIGDDAGRFVAAVKSQGPATDANARLIAAAPEALAACKMALAYLNYAGTENFERGGDRHVREVLESAIRKATED